ncbi:Alpha/Beta hydrolase protein [Stachybotrys elegans]|uniref:Alpha/Beta hydrolase protein n=1 Tax=Stachybotrys elegans TaxID=80388 RepID=A0A8K0SYF4_9HYPO|nr:Alpha/Beta hydrolase protein [Stachybotrys elegans]
MALTYDFIRLATKPAAQLCFGFVPAAASPAPSQTPPILAVFLNGLGRPQAAWEQTVHLLRQSPASDALAILTYDRFGQGKTEDRDPADEGSPDPSHAHDCASVVADLHQLISQIVADKMGVSDPRRVRLLLVGNSIGCSLARLYAQAHPGAVAGAVLLDSTLTDTDFVSIFPDPDASGFDGSKLPAGVTPQDLRTTRRTIGAIFHPSVGSKEGLSRRNLAELLPHADSPPLQGYGQQPPFITVIGHDRRTFADATCKDLKIPVEVTESYMNPYWHRYNQGLAKLTDPARSVGPLEAPDAGHFIQVDNPGFVASHIQDVLGKIQQ